MLNLRSSVVVVGCVFVGFLASAGPGLVARAAEPDRWIARVTTSSESAFSSDDSASPPDGHAAQRRITQLEQQVKELEAERRAAPRQAQPSKELDAVVARNRELTERNRSLAAENQSLVQSRLFEPPAATCEAPPESADARAQLRYWAEQLRKPTKGFRGKLTVAQNSALNVLLQEERTLDPHNPWR